MSVVSALILIAIVLVIYIVLIDIFTILFRLTGLTREKAKFQVISMITAVGFTTSESEIISNDRKRRRLAVACMFTGVIFSVAIIGLLINLVMSIGNNSGAYDMVAISIIVGSVVVLLIILKLPFSRKLFEKLITLIGNRLMYHKTNQNILTLLDSYGKNSIIEVAINRIPLMLKEKHIFETGIKTKYNINILMIKRNNQALDVTKDTMIQNGDVLVLFGNSQLIYEMFHTNLDSIELNYEESDYNIIKLIDNYGSEAMAEIIIKHLPRNLKNKTLFESDIKGLYDINVLTIKRDDNAIRIDGDTIIKNGDTIIVFGSYMGIKELFDNKEKK